MSFDQIIRSILLRMLPFAAALGLLTGCSPPPEAAAERVTVAVNPVLRGATLLLASEGAAANGLNIEIQRFTTGKEATMAMLKGEADYSTVAEFAFVGLGFAHPDLRIVAVLSSVQADEVLARRDRGIAQPADLRGKTIGVVAGTDAEFYLHGFLLAQGLRPTDAHIVLLAPEQISPALVEGKVDAVCTWEPHTYLLKQQLGDQVVAWSAQGGQGEYWLLVSRAQVLKDKPEATRRLLRAVLRAEQNLRANPAAYRVSLATLTGMPANQQEATWKDYKFGLSLPQELLVAMEAGARWRMAAGLTPPQPVPNYIHNIDAAGLEAVLPTAVTLIH